MPQAPRALPRETAYRRELRERRGGDSAMKARSECATRMILIRAMRAEAARVHSRKDDVCCAMLRCRQQMRHAFDAA